MWFSAGLVDEAAEIVSSGFLGLRNGGVALIIS